MEERLWHDDRANQLLDAARVVLEAAGGWQAPEDDHGDDPADLLRFAELYFSEGVRRRIWPHVDQINRGIREGELEEQPCPRAPAGPPTRSGYPYALG